MSAALVLSLLACDGGEPPPPALDLSTVPAVQHDCAAAQCAASADLLACLEQSCAVEPASWVVDPQSVRYNRADGILHVEVAVQHTPMKVGEASTPYAEESYLGVTVLDRAGQDIDLAVQTVFPAQIGEPFTFSAEVGGEVQDIIFGLWGEKIEPCDVDRSGCRNFGFVLDKSLAAWPPLTYIEPQPRRQRILEAAPSLMIQGSGAPADTLAAAAPRAQAALSAELERFGLEAPAPTVTLGESALPLGLQVLHRDPHDGPLASAVADALGASAVAADARLPADIVVQIGGDSAAFDCHQQSCAALTDTALQECMAQCP